MPEFNIGSATQTLDSVLGESAASNLQENAFTWYLKAHGRLLTPATSETPYTFNSKEEAIAFAKQKYKTNWQNIVPTTYNVANSLQDQPDSGWNEKELNVQHEDEEPQQKRKPVVIKTNKPVGSRVADIGPGGKEYNVKTNKAWDDQHKKVDEDSLDDNAIWNQYGHYNAQDLMQEFPNISPKDAESIVSNAERGWTDPTYKQKYRDNVVKLVKMAMGQQGVAEGKADPTGSWVVYSGSKVKRFKTRDGAKAYAEKTGGKVASGEFYADNIQKQGVTETTSSGSMATSMGGGNGFVNGGPGTIARPKMKKKK
jgi:hypothetical protein